MKELSFRFDSSMKYSPRVFSSRQKDISYSYPLAEVFSQRSYLDINIFKLNLEYSNLKKARSRFAGHLKVNQSALVSAKIDQSEIKPE